ncbi:stage II sporulation protein GA (sporulation sigma-E factor processing peptidase) [Geomicrobium halophilum]|uniref:Sporulation sigma-E factor-processing peptidase n=1 Tax=Geomicrobium halophilum TaxID=549000 RepID=A0A841PKT2_9BACL|nr:sigma-E processing peptidase SpoIIGA [Geomicrobium halophilum]MBB6449380.1 stage II sporulation protein GA (sporulation sigma-E factor processing peptidase) [Geomicrobium halophilum]
MTLYIDVIYALNTVVTACLLYMTAKWLGYKFKKTRIAMAAALSSLPLFIWMTPYGEWLLHPLIQALVCILTISLAFGFQTFTRFSKAVLLFYFVSWLAGGAVMAMTMFWQTSALLERWSSSARWVLFDDMHGLLVLSTLPVVIVFAEVSKRIIKQEKKTAAGLALITIKMDAKSEEIHATGLVDTGNQLRDPISRAPVLLAEVSLFKPHLTSEEWRAMVEWLDSQGSKGAMKWEERLKLIPYRTVGRDHGFLFAVHAAEVLIKQQGSQKRNRNVLIGFENRQLSTEGRFRCIVPTDFLPASPEVESAS